MRAGQLSSLDISVPNCVCCSLRRRQVGLDVVVVTLNERNAAPETCSDEMLIRWIAEGDQLAMRMLFNRRRVALYRWLLQLVGDKALAEDLSLPKIISGRIGGAARTGSGAGPLDRPT